MKLEIERSRLKENNLYPALRRLGYFPIFDQKTRKASYVRKINPQSRYPRFHLYLDEKNEKTIFSLHLDQSQTRYKNQKAHQGEYEGTIIEEEMERIISTLLKN